MLNRSFTSRRLPTLALALIGFGLASVCLCARGGPLAPTRQGAARGQGKLSASLPAGGGPAVKTGLETLEQQNFAPLAGKRIGLITNPTGIDSHLRATVDLLAHASGVKLVALFGPEHGVRGDATAGAEVGNGMDRATGLPTYSLYGKTQKPTAEMLRGIDTLVYDIQDIGSRSYTYISTLGLCMEAAADNHIPLVVLDRPNPCGGERIEGNIAARSFRSFVGRYPIPYVYGLTVGELAQMLNGAGMLAGGRKCDLTVIPLQGWRRDMTWAETGLPWVLTSPHIPHPETALYYAATGIVGEQPTLNIGVGYTLPFELAGAPGLSPSRLAADLNSRHLAGVAFRPLSWTPFYAGHKATNCGGVQIYFTDPRHAELSRLNFEIMDAVRHLDSGLNFFPAARERMFDLVCGTDAVRKMFQAGSSSAEIWAVWNADSAAFRRKRQPYLLYP